LAHASVGRPPIRGALLSETDPLRIYEYLSGLGDSPFRIAEVILLLPGTVVEFHRRCVPSTRIFAEWTLLDISADWIAILGRFIRDLAAQEPYPVIAELRTFLATSGAQTDLRPEFFLFVLDIVKRVRISGRVWSGLAKYPSSPERDALTAYLNGQGVEELLVDDVVATMGGQ
jgi:hypothetical protein